MKLILIFLINLYIIRTQDTTIVIGEKDKQINLEQKCQGFQINTNFKNIKINITKMHKIEKLIFTDLPISDCNTCDPLAQICQSNNLFTRSTINKRKLRNKFLNQDVY
jgi:hypothetical protein